MELSWTIRTPNKYFTILPLQDCATEKDKRIPFLPAS